MYRLRDIVKDLAERRLDGTPNPLEIDWHVDIGQFEVLGSPFGRRVFDVVEDATSERGSIAADTDEQIGELAGLDSAAVWWTSLFVLTEQSQAGRLHDAKNELSSQMLVLLRHVGAIGTETVDKNSRAADSPHA